MLMMISKSLYCDFKEIIVVRVPAPAIKGNAMGTTEADLVWRWSCLKKLRPNIISMAMIKMMIEPATAKDALFTPKNLRMDSPNHNINIIKTNTNTKFRLLFM